MYVSPKFPNHKSEWSDFIIQRKALAVMASYNNTIIMSNIPLVRVKDKLYGHLAKMNPHSKVLQNHEHVQILFTGPEAYISPTWYAKPHKSVPTWNYCSVQIEAEVFKFTENADLKRILAIQVEAYEKEGWALNSIDSKLLDGMLQEIVGFEFLIRKEDSKFKVSQNKKSEEIANIITKLEQNTDLSMADFMRGFYGRDGF